MTAIEAAMVTEGEGTLEEGKETSWMSRRLPVLLHQVLG